MIYSRGREKQERVPQKFFVAACCGQKKKKRFFWGHPAPGRDAALPAPSLLDFVG
jgi:hypothetical protein